MKACFPIIMVLLAPLLIPYASVYGQNHTEYTIRIASNGSALWTITQTGTGIQVSNDTIVEFQQKIALLLESARNATSRDMVANTTSITITPSGSYVVVEYEFYWANFSKTENARITIGDVFQAPDFFLQLYGDGEVSVTYPSEYVVETALPVPYEQTAFPRTLTWLGTLDLNKGQPSIVLRKASSTPLEFLEQNVLLILGGVITIGGLSAGLYLLRKRKRRNEVEKKRQPGVFLLMENDEDKIVKLLRSSGGSMYQSAIADQCRFSKAKTSQLLASMESRGLISRYKKGRDKIVSIAEPSKSERH